MTPNEAFTYNLHRATILAAVFVAIPAIVVFVVYSLYKGRRKK
jgi:Co/Zn/Cd efflux system component